VSSVSDANIALLRRAWAAYDRGDEEEFSSCLTPDWKEYDGADFDRSHGGTLEDERRTMRLHRIAFPDKHTDIHIIVADEDIAACQCTTSATHTGRYLDAEATGKTVVIHEMMFNRVRDGKLCETWAMADGSGFYEQITGKKTAEQLDNMG
jgi:predicted ester cyclase